MKTAVILITGFRQDYLKLAGLETQQRILEIKMRHRDDVEVYEHLLWKDDMKAFAAMLKRDSVDRAIIAGYSYGGGFGAQMLTKHLLKLGIEVTCQILCDPVHRSRILPTWKVFVPLTFRSLTPWAKVSVDRRVGNVVGVRQERNKPKAHPIKWRGHVWKLPLAKRLDGETDKSPIIHSTIDECEDWRCLLFDTVSQIVGKEEQS